MFVSKLSKLGIVASWLLIAAVLGSVYTYASQLLWDARGLPGVVALGLAAIVVTATWLVTVMFLEPKEEEAEAPRAALPEIPKWREESWKPVTKRHPAEKPPTPVVSG